MEADPLDDLARLGGVADVRHHDAGGSGFKGADVIAVAAAGDPDHRVDVVDAGGADLVLEPDPVVGHVLGAEPDGVDAAQRGTFDHPRVVEVDFEDRGELPFADEAEDAAGSVLHES